MTTPSKSALPWKVRVSKLTVGVRPISRLARFLNGPAQRHLDVSRRRVALAGLPSPFAGLRIAHLSDFHADGHVGYEPVRIAVDAALHLAPDLIAITGDFVNRLDDATTHLLAHELKRLHAPLGVFAVLGNHDHWAGADAVLALLRRVGLTVLHNDAIAVERDGARLHLAGVDDVGEGSADLARALRSVPTDECALLLCHAPDFADVAAGDPRVVLQLSGHSHGGQVCAPGGRPIWLPNHGRLYPEGLHQIGGLTLYTSRGIGACYPPIRINCRPEVALLELVTDAGEP